MTIMNARAITPSWAIENGTPVDLPTMKVAAAVPGPQKTRAAVPRNSTASLRESRTSAIGTPQQERDMNGRLFGQAEQYSAAFTPGAPMSRHRALLHSCPAT